MAYRDDIMINPNVESLLERVDSKFTLVTLASRRARQINAYFGQLGEGLGAQVPPQVTSEARKPLSLAFQEIGSDKISYERISDEELASVDRGANVDPVLALLEGGGEGDDDAPADDAS